MISKLDKVLVELEKKEVKLQEHLTQSDAGKSELVHIDEIIKTIRKVRFLKKIIYLISDNI